MDTISSLTSSLGGLGGLSGFSYKFDWNSLVEALNLSPVLQFLVNLIISLS